MKYAPKKVFILENGKYIEISYEEFCRREETDTTYKDKLFIFLHGMLMEVTANDYLEFHKDKRRQKYIDERSVENGDFSYDMLTTDDFNGEEILIDDSEDISTAVVYKIMSDKLRQAILTLSKEEQLLIRRYYYEEISETKLSSTYGITQQAISKRISKIITKLKKLLEN